MPVLDTPRPLSPAELAVLEHLLDPADPVHAALSRQIPHALVASHCGCGCPTVSFLLGPEAEPAEVTSSYPVAADADVIPPGETCVGGVIVFARGGLLTGLELYSWLDDAIPDWPPLEHLRPTVE